MKKLLRSNSNQTKSEHFKFNKYQKKRMEVKHKNNALNYKQSKPAQNIKKPAVKKNEYFVNIFKSASNKPCAYEYGGLYLNNKFQNNLYGKSQIISNKIGYPKKPVYIFNKQAMMKPNGHSKSLIFHISEGDVIVSSFFECDVKTKCLRLNINLFKIENKNNKLIAFKQKKFFSDNIEIKDNLNIYTILNPSLVYDLIKDNKKFNEFINFYEKYTDAICASIDKLTSCFTTYSYFVNSKKALENDEVPGSNKELLSVINDSIKLNQLISDSNLDKLIKMLN